MDNEFISVMGAALGFNILEKHFTHKYGEKRIDAQSAVSIKQMKKIKRLLNKANLTYGTNDLSMSDAEKKYGDTGPMKKAIVARNKIIKGDKIRLVDMAFKRTNESSTLKQFDFSKLVGLEAAETIEKDTLINFSNVNYVFQKHDNFQFKNMNK